MGFLDKLWDETLAGPKPDTGLGKLRKYDSFSATRSSPAIRPDDIHISRTITILRTNRHFSAVDSCSEPSSPAAPTTPTSPFTPVTPSGGFKKWMRRKSTMEALDPPEPRSPNVHDWIILNALDR
ncbi:dormancy-associated protein homolog 4 [Malania oleifera]|uniref:dormancy-associated protein homolog 4 n=1 Tax=Malania oleifera TaxID=397392 RepID=UPI0025ADACD0|nr:dormancy-associated protein homolog 4 [Malania oleifera]